jgi:hypothetical protein
MKHGYYTVECNNCIFITYWNGSQFIEDDKMLADFLRKYPVKVKSCFKELEK